MLYIRVKYPTFKMTKTITLLLGLLCVNFSFSQNYKYEFAIIEISNYAPAKLAITKIRDITGAQIVKFDDDTDQFIILSHLDFDPLNLKEKFQINGIEVVGIIEKTNVE